MARKRDRYRIKSNVAFNGKSLEGIEVAHIGMVASSGKVSPIKRENTYLHLRVIDPKALRALGLHPLKHRDRVVAPQHLSSFYEGPLV